MPYFGKAVKTFLAVHSVILPGIPALTGTPALTSGTLALLGNKLLEVTWVFLNTLSYNLLQFLRCFTNRQTRGAGRNA